MNGGWGGVSSWAGTAVVAEALRADLQLMVLGVRLHTHLQLTVDGAPSAHFMVVSGVPYPQRNRAAPEGTARMRERVTGIEPAYSAWEADVLPLNYTRRTLGRG